MTPAADRVRAIGRLASDGPWIGFAETGGDYDLIAGDPGGGVRVLSARDARDRRTGLVAAAIAYFLSSLDPPPAELEATQADIAAVVRHVAAGANPGADADLAHEALDAIDDGLPGDAVALRLSGLLPEPWADPVAILADRLSSTRSAR